MGDDVFTVRVAFPRGALDDTTLPSAMLNVGGVDGSGRQEVTQ